ncbi:MAG: type VI secretion system-associated protein TagF [bacterium]
MATMHFQAGCFGKLPQHGDFIRHNAGTREMLAFDQWLQQGLLHLKTQLRERWEAAYSLAPAYHFLFYADNAERFLTGILFPSHDKAERKYPFWVSVHVERPTLGEQMMPLVPLIFSPFFARCLPFCREARQGLEMREIAARTEALQMKVTHNSLPEIRRHNFFLSDTSQAVFWSRLFGRFEDPRKYLLVKNMLEILTPFRQKELSRLSLGLRFPLAQAAEELAHSAVFWLQMSFKLLGNPVATPILFWSVPEREKGAYLYLFFRPPSAKSFLQLIQPEAPSDNICELEKEGADKIALAARALKASYREMLEMPEMKLDEMLMRL